MDTTKYIALISAPESCDYNIACGKEWVELKARNRAQAVDELYLVLVGNRDDGYGCGYESKYWEHEDDLEEVVLLEVSEQTPIPFKSWFTAATLIIEKEDADKAQDAPEDDAERKEYERLKEKYG